MYRISTTFKPVLVFLLVSLLAGCGFIPTTKPTTKKQYTCSSANNINTAQVVYNVPIGNNDLVGKVETTKVYRGDTLRSIAYCHNIGYDELLQANPNVVPRAYGYFIGEKIKIPVAYILPAKKYRHGIVVNIPEKRLYYFFDKDKKVMVFPVAIGRAGWATPLGRTYVLKKKEDPTWHVPESIREQYEKYTGKQMPKIYPPGPNNPLGHYALYLGFKGILIHGTPLSYSVGSSASHGCIRMYNPDIKRLFQIVKRGTEVHVIYQPYKIGWANGNLYLEDHRVNPKIRTDYKQDMQQVRNRIMAVIANKNVEVNWQKVAQVMKQHSGLPTVVGHTIAALPTPLSNLQS